MLPPLAAWRVSLHRTRADWPIVSAAWLITLLASTLLAAGPIYADAVSLAGLRRTLADAPVSDANLEAELWAERDSARDLDLVASRELEAAAGVLARPIERSGTTEAFSLPSAEADDITRLGFMEGLEDHATLVAGRWPTPATGVGIVGVAVAEPVARALDLAVGDRLELASRVADDVEIPVRIDGVFAIMDRNDPFWWGRPAEADGIQQTGERRTFAPFFGASESILARDSGGSVHLVWHAYPDFAGLSVDEIGELRERVERLPRTLEQGVGAETGVHTGLPAILLTAERSLLVGRTGVLLLLLQLAVLAAYAILLAAGMLAEHRRADTAMLRARGSSLRDLGAMALLEAVLLAVPAGILGPWLAAAGLHILEVTGPLAEIELRLEPTPTAAAVVAALVAAVGCAGLLVVQALLAARAPAGQELRRRQETATLGARLGLDLALVAVAAVGLWQLRIYGGPLTQSVRGVLGLDPLLVAAPAIGLLAGSVLALRMLPSLAQMVEAAVVRGRSLIGALGAFQLARRPLRYTRAALLLTLATSMGVFAISYAATWSRSQHEQAAFQMGADVSVVPSVFAGRIPAWALGQAYRAQHGVGSVTPIEHQSLEAGARGSAKGELLALDSRAGAEMLDLRPDLSDASISELLRRLAAGRPAPRLPVIEEPTDALRVSARVDITRLLRPVFVSGARGVRHVSVSDGVLFREPVIGAVVTVRDANGLFHRFRGEPVPLAKGAEQIEVPLDDPDPDSQAAVDAADGGLAFPLEIAAMDLDIRLPRDSLAVSGFVGVSAVASHRAAGTGVAWEPVPLGPAGWELSLAPLGDLPRPIGPAYRDGLALRLTTATIIPGEGLRSGPSTRVGYLAQPIEAVAAEPVEAIVNPAFLSATAASEGETVRVEIDQGDVELRISDVVSAFPGTDPGLSVAVVDLPTLAMHRLASGATALPDAWWIEADGVAPDELAATLQSGPFAGSAAASLDERVRRLSTDPVALGVIGALGIGFVVGALFAVVGLALNAAVSVRQRRTEFALLRALGLAPGQLGAWLWLENAGLVLVSLLGGTLLGIVLGWVVLPFITVTQLGAAAFPPVIVELPWVGIAILDGLVAVALGITVLGLAITLRRVGIGSVLRMGED